MQNKLLMLPNVSVDPKYLKEAPLSTLKLSYEVKDMDQLLWDLATNKPMWSFLITRGVLTIDHDVTPVVGDLRVRTVELRHGSEVLGAINVGYHGSERKIYLENARIKASRSRRNDGKLVTSDYKRAYREVLKNFFCKNPQELVDNAHERIRTKLNETVFTHYRAARSALSELQEIAGNIAMNNIELFQQFPVADTIKQDLYTNYELVRRHGDLNDEAKRMVDGLSESKVSGSMAIVISHGDTYVLAYKGSAQVIASDELPQELRAPLGMLKLSDTDTMVPGIGVKVSDSIFAVTPGEMK